MNKQEFLECLRKGLTGLPQEDIEEYRAFYSEMIDDRIEEGMSEAEAVSEIGTTDDIIAQILADTARTKLAKENGNKKARDESGKKKKSYGGLLASAVLAALAAIVIITAVMGGEANDNPVADNPRETEQTHLGTLVAGPDVEETYRTRKTLIDTQQLKVTFVRAYTVREADPVLYFVLEAENGFDRRVRICCSDARFNGKTTSVMSCEPFELNVGKQHNFFVNQDIIGITSLEELDSAEFRIKVYDSETMQLLYTSDKISIDFDN